MHKKRHGLESNVNNMLSLQIRNHIVAKIILHAEVTQSHTGICFIVAAALASCMHGSNK